MWVKTISRPKILEINGMCLRDFPSQEDALKCADRLIEKSCADFEFEMEVEEDKEMPLLSKYRYQHSSGTSHSWRQTQSKHLKGDTQLKSAKALQDSAAMMEAMGPSTQHEDMEEPMPESTVQVTSQEWDVAHTASIDLRLPLLDLVGDLLQL